MEARVWFAWALLSMQQKTAKRRVPASKRMFPADFSLLTCPPSGIALVLNDGYNWYGYRQTDRNFYTNWLAGSFQFGNLFHTMKVILMQKNLMMIMIKHLFSLFFFSVKAFTVYFIKLPRWRRRTVGLKLQAYWCSPLDSNYSNLADWTSLPTMETFVHNYLKSAMNGNHYSVLK